MNTEPIRFASCDQFIKHCHARYRNIKELDPTIRYGQIIFNELAVHRPDLSEQIRGTDNDPFHHDGLFSWTENWLQLNW